MMYEGDLYQIPRDFNAANMFFNTDLLKAAGLEMPAEDWTKDDFHNYAKAMTGRVVTLPQRSDVDALVSEQLIVELYSK